MVHVLNIGLVAFGSRIHGSSLLMPTQLWLWGFSWPVLSGISADSASLMWKSLVQLSVQ